MDHHTLGYIIGLLAISVVVTSLFRRLHLPPILAYLVVGVALTPWLGDPDHESQASAHLLGEIGVAFLLFTIGLEFSLTQFWAMRRTLFGLGGLQVLGGTISGGLIAWSIGIDWAAALVVGGALSMSSTAIVIKQLTDQLELQDQHGRFALGILLFQDLAAVPFLVVIPILALGGEQGLLLPLAIALVKGLVAMVVMLGVGRLLLRPLFHEVAAARSAEIFTLTVLLVTLLAAWLTAEMGLSLALGAFLAGMMLSETEYRHQIEVEVRPFRDVLLAFFFVNVGLQLDLWAVAAVWHWVLLLVAGLVFGKGPLIALLTWLMGREWRVATRTGLCLAHGGEFGIALLALAWNNELLSSAEIQPILAAVVISMVVAPLFIRYGEPLSELLSGQRKKESGETAERADEIAAAAEEAQDHVILCGYGRVGQHIGQVLREEGISYLALDLNPRQIRHAWEGGDAVFYGDASQEAILKAAQIDTALALVVSFHDVHYAIRLIHAARRLRSDLPILVRAQDESYVEALLDAGATDVVPETVETGTMLSAQVLLLNQRPADEVFLKIRARRRSRYRTLALPSSDGAPDSSER